MAQSNLFNDTGDRRYTAMRSWNPAKLRLTVVMSNPAALDGSGENPTTRAVMAIACHNGFGAVTILNLDPRISSELLQDGPVSDAVNDQVLAGMTGPWWAAWGDTARMMPGAAKAIGRLASATKPLGLWLTKAGNPAHPARKPHSSRLQPVSAL